MLQVWRKEIELPVLLEVIGEISSYHHIYQLEPNAITIRKIYSSKRPTTKISDIPSKLHNTIWTTGLKGWNMTRDIAGISEITTGLTSKQKRTWKKRMRKRKRARRRNLRWSKFKRKSNKFNRKNSRKKWVLRKWSKHRKIQNPNLNNNKNRFWILMKKQKRSVLNNTMQRRLIYR